MKISPLSRLCPNFILKYGSIEEEKKQGKNHLFDVWHFVKNIKKKLINASQKASCKILSKWVKSIRNHLWCACTTSMGDVELLQEKWISILFHIHNKHEWTSLQNVLTKH